MNDSRPSGAAPPGLLRPVLRATARGLGWASLALVWLWCVLALWWSPLPGAPLRGLAAGLFAIGAPLAARRLRPRLPAPATFLATAAIVALAWSATPASLDRDWSPDQAILPRVRIDGDRVRLTGVRHCVYRAADDYDVRHEDRDYDLRTLERADFGLERLSSWDGVAHTFLTFGFADGRWLAISVEIRKEKGEQFSPLRGLFKQYELMYVLADERDVIALRTHHRRDEVFLYPIRASREKLRALLLSMLERAESLASRPEFYHTLTSTCTTNIVRHIDVLAPGAVPFSLKVLLPGYSDRLAYDLGLLDTRLPYEEIRTAFRIDEVARQSGEGEDFSARIRTGRTR